LNGSSPIGERIVRPMVEEIHGGLMRQLDEISVEDLCRRAEERGLAEPIGERADFAI
jgi:hypothetical protein